MNARTSTKTILSVTAVMLTMLALSLNAGECGGGKCDPRGKGGQHGMRGGGHGGGPGIMMMLADLNLSEEQMGQVADIVKSSREGTQDTQKQIRELRGKGMKLTTADTIDEDAIRANARQIADLEADLMIARAKEMQKVKAVLTPEQKELLESKKSERKEKMEQMKEKMSEFRKMMKDQKEDQ